MAIHEDATPNFCTCTIFCSSSLSLSLSLSLVLLYPSLLCVAYLFSLSLFDVPCSLSLPFSPSCVSVREYSPLHPKIVSEPCAWLLVPSFLPSLSLSLSLCLSYCLSLVLCLNLTVVIWWAMVRSQHDLETKVQHVHTYHAAEP